MEEHHAALFTVPLSYTSHKLIAQMYAYVYIYTRTYISIYTYTYIEVYMHIGTVLFTHLMYTYYMSIEMHAHTLEL